jgi:hypothetical protein
MASDFRRLLLFLATMALAPQLSGCGDTKCDDCDDGGGAASGAGASGSGAGGAGGGGPCTDTTGLLRGAVSLFEPPGGPNAVPAPGALLDLRQKPDDVPLHAMAGDDASYEVELPAGAWIVGGESADTYCTTFEPETVTVVACATTEHDLVLEACVN